MTDPLTSEERLGAPGNGFVEQAEGLEPPGDCRASVHDDVTVEIQRPIPAALNTGEFKSDTADVTGGPVPGRQAHPRPGHGDGGTVLEVGSSASGDRRVLADSPPPCSRA